MQLQVQVRKRFPIEVLREQIESVKGEHISYTLTDKDTHYVLSVKYGTGVEYSEFMERLRDLWERKS